MANRSQPSPDDMAWRKNVAWYTQETTSFMRFARVAVRTTLNTIAGLECRGFENLPAGGACIVALNHLSLWDVVYMGAYLPRFPHFMAKAELYKNAVFGTTIRLLGSFPVYRGERDSWAMAQAGRVLEAGQVLAMFPEGTRSGRQAELKQGKVGVVKLALEHRSPVVPLAIWGTENFKIGFSSRPNIKIKMGEPLDMVARAGSPPYSRETVRELTTVLMERIAEMLPPAYRGVYS